MKEKGFSLVELLAVIIILSIAALISVPLIMGIINDSKLNGLKDSAYGILKSANLYFSQYEPETNIRFDIEENQVTSKDAEEMISYKGYVKSGSVIVNATGKITMCITDGKNSVYKNYSDKSIVVVENDSCYIPENQAIVYLANGGATLDELDNAELTDLVTTLQEEINSLKSAKEAQNNLITTLQAKIDTLETGLSSKADQSDLNTVNSNISSMSTQIETIGTIANSSTLDKAYPVGSIYVSVKNTNPSTLFGGTWVSFGTGRTLVGVDTSQTEFNSVEKTGGEKTHTLTVAEIPSHTHGSKSLTGTVKFRDITAADHNFVAGSTGIFGTSISEVWSGEHTAAAGTSATNPHWNTISINATHTHDSVGGDGAHNNLQPYITVYMWKRTA